MAHRFLRRKALCEACGMSYSALYRREQVGLFVHPVRLGPRAVGWPAHEIEAVNTALIAGAPDDAIRALVAQLHAARYPDGKPPADIQKPMRPVKPGRPRKEATK